MALTDVLRERVSRRGRTAEVDCGALGTVTVEALSPRECAALGMSDGGRALLYAACRELQEAGEALRREKRLFTPGEITQYVSDGEALAAARTVLALSGLDQPENRLDSVQEFEKDFSEIRLGSVQEPDSPGAEMLAQGENRLDSVQKPVNQFSEIRPGIVQFPEGAPADGQVSREFSPDFENAGGTQRLGANFRFEPQNLELSEKNGTFSAGTAAAQWEAVSRAERFGPHETESEFPEAPHEIKSEFRKITARNLHETESEIQDAVHEITSEFAGNGRGKPHEITSEFPVGLHETESEFRGGVHETTSEIDENRRGGLHEITSESAEKLARYLLEGLRRAAAVR